MIHGFGCTGSVFGKMIYAMQHYFRVTTIDLLGQGGSGRPAFNLTTAEQCIDYFIFSIEAWLQATNFRDEGSYMLLGHSLGGYVAANFAIRFPEAISKVLLVSAVGITPRPEHLTHDTLI